VRRRIVSLIAAVVLAALLTGCKVDAVTTITVAPNGSGVVNVRAHLDADAVRVVERNGVKLDQQIALADLPKAGWRVTPWQRNTDGSADIQLSHSFGNEQDLVQVLGALTGRDGVLRDPQLIHSRNFVRDRDGVTVTADLSALKSGVRQDKELSSRLQAAGIDVAAVDYVLGAQLKDSFSLALTLRVPHNETRTYRFHAGQRQSVDLASSNIHWNQVMMLLIGSILVFLALLLYLSASISARRRRARELEFVAVRSRRGSQPLM
jgi:hypothetical protein